MHHPLALINSINQFKTNKKTKNQHFKQDYRLLAQLRSQESHTPFQADSVLLKCPMGNHHLKCSVCKEVVLCPSRNSEMILPKIMDLFLIKCWYDSELAALKGHLITLQRLSCYFLLDFHRLSAVSLQKDSWFYR